MKDKVSEIFAEGFHKHLNECPQCMNQPFNLCPIGTVLIRFTIPDGQDDIQHYEGVKDEGLV